MALLVRVATLAALAITLTSCGLQSGVGPQTGDSGVAPSPAPRLSGTTLDGKRLDIRAWHGHPIVIDWWGSWCGPCRKEQPELNALAQHFSPRGVHFVGVDIRDDLASARAYYRDFHVPYTSIFDPGEATAGAWGIEAPPTIVVVDASGNIRSRFLGTLTGIEALLTSLLGKGG
jgi:thiol-disulfide isomerase/thioredoxin